MERPRLGSDVRARRHLVGASAHVILHTADGRAMAIGEREWRVVSAMDGTRDARGVSLASGVAAAEVAAFVRTLAELGLLDDGVAPEDGAETAFARDVPVRGLPGYRFGCEGTGACCAQFGTLLFTPLEAARARAVRPDVLDGGQRPDAVFLPERGLDRTLLAVTMRDGACVYRDPDGRCGIHAAAGAAHKPFGCRTFPARFVDVGDEIRVTPRPECACVFDEGGAEPLTEAARGVALPRETFVPRLPDRIRMGDAEIDAPGFVAWCDDLEVPSGADLAAWCDARADALSQELPSERDRAASIERMHASAERLRARDAGWRAEADPVRRMTGWVCAALAALRGGATPTARDGGAERLYVRAALFGAALAGAPSVRDGLRQMALHLRVARAVQADDPIARHPIAVVEALARGHDVTAFRT